MKSSLLLMVSLIFLASCEQGPVGNANVPEPRKSVDLQRYLGKWYEIGRYENRFEKQCYAVTAEYTLRKDGAVAVLNSCYQGSVHGPLKTAEGKAYVVPESNQAKLRVSFFGPFYGDYWVLDHAEDYSWSIVGEPSGRFLWILSRDPQPSAAVKKQLFTITASMGYDLNLLYETPQISAHRSGSD